MIKKVVNKQKLTDTAANGDLAYWLQQSPADRVAAVETLRRQYYGSSARLQRSARVIQRSPR